MKALVWATSLAFSVTAVASPFNNITESRPVCFSREYSDQHLARHPKQTVQSMTMKFSKDANSGEGIMLGINAKIKRVKTLPSGDTITELKPYTTGMGCFLEGETLRCMIDCDGGSAKVTWNVTDKGNEIEFKNEGFVMYGGCGEEVNEEDTIWLDPVKGGDDVFRLFALPTNDCKKLKFNY